MSLKGQFLNGRDSKGAGVRFDCNPSGVLDFGVDFDGAAISMGHLSE